METNRRRAPRTPIRLDVQVMNGDPTHWQTSTEDLSDSGAFILWPPGLELQQGEKIQLQVQGPIAAPVITAEVVRFSQKGFGVRFIQSAE